MRIFICCATLLILTLHSEAEWLLQESFDYPDGSIVGAEGSPWATHSGTAQETTVTSGKLQISAARSEDIHALLSGQPYTPASQAVLYASFTVNFSSLPTPSGTYFAHFNSSNFRARIFAGTTGAGAGYFRLGIGNGDSSVNAQLPYDLSVNENYFIVVRYDVATGTSTLWLNPVAESDPGATASDSASAVNITAFAFRQSSGEGVMLIDDLKVATSFSEAISESPVTAPMILSQPQSLTVYAGSTVEFSVEAQGSAPLAYQWQFNGTNLNDATFPVLSLTNVTDVNVGNYSVIISNFAGVTNSIEATLTVESAPPAALSILNYNVRGNMVENWTTNSFQVRAIGRKVSFLNPDVITFQEIPATNTHQMTNFIKAFLPGYHLATNSGTDGFDTNIYIRSVIASRYPIVRSQSWLDGANLDPFGYTNSNFTRDLFEAEIAVPGFLEPLHVFTTHLKSGTGSSADAAKRAAEASAISNFFVTTFLPAKGNRPYLLTGDLNEDINVPATGSQQPIQRLANNSTGLRLTSPLNPVTESELTFSIRATELTRRYDYILPGGLLFSNIVASEVFRTDVLNPVPPGLFANDSRNASDHLPVLMFFANPYTKPFLISSIEVASSAFTLQWQSESGRAYAVEASTDLTNWTALATNQIASGTNASFSTNLLGNERFFRVLRDD